jgi:colanic acid/amylovoran biosynthesis glycosyltransferase
VKIIYITASLPHGSDEAFIIPEIQQLMRSGHEVLVIPRSPRGRIIHGHALLDRARLESPYSPRVIKAAAMAAPRQIGAAVLPLLGSRSALVAIKNLAIVPKALWLAGVAVRWGAGHIHCHWAGTTATMAMLASRISGIPWSLTAHRWDIVENNLLAAKVNSASFVRFISDDGLRMAREMNIGPAGNARVLHMGVAIPGTVRRRYVPRPVVLCPARLVEVKGHRFLLEAWRILRSRGLEGELWMAGQGELRASLESLSEKLGLADSVKFLGAIPHRELLQFYEDAAVSVVVLPSIDLGNGHHEGIPVALLEAMSYGIPVVGTPAGGTSELVVPGTGLLAPPADPVALADGIQSLLRDGNLAEQLGDCGRRRVIEAFDIIRVTAELVHEFEASKRRTVSGELQYA